jgi:membrane protease YdiL (CAAX protease family)
MGSERPLSYAAAIAWTLAATALLIFVGSAVVTARPGVAVDIVTLAGIEAVIFLLGTFGLLRLHAEERTARNALGMRPTHPALPVFGLALGLALHPPAETLRALVTRFRPESEANLAHKAALLAADTPVRAVMLVVAAVCVVPLVEEVFFRGAIFSALRRSQTAAGAAVVTALCFVMTHVEMRDWPSLLLVAIVMSHLRVASGSLLPCLALHVAFNGATIAAHLTGVSSVTQPAPLGWPVVLAGWIATAALVFAVQYVAQRSPEAERARAEDAE